LGKAKEGRMQCMKCGSEKDRVVDSRLQGGDVWRRRECRDCGERWTTVESAKPSDAVIQSMVDSLVESVREITGVMAILKKVRSRGGVG
jgi:transcriptional regulator NrdR family protein